LQLNVKGERHDALWVLVFWSRFGLIGNAVFRRMQELGTCTIYSGCADNQRKP
jgi:hypothetical protein